MRSDAPVELVELMTSRMGDEKSEDFEVWKDNWVTAQFFFAVSTQWIIKSGECIGLCHKAIESTMNMMGIHKRKRKKLFSEIKVMESAALETIKDLKAECQR